MRPDLALLTVDQLDKAKRTITFALAADQVSDLAKAAKPLAGTGVFRVGSDMPVGKIAGVEVRKALGRAFVTVKITDADAWAKAKHGVFRAAQCKLYGGALGSLNLVDTPFDDAAVLHKAASKSAADLLRDALVAAGWDGRYTLSKVAGDPAAMLAAALRRAERTSAELAKALPAPQLRLDDAWWAAQGCRKADDGFYHLDPDLCLARRTRLRVEAIAAAVRQGVRA